VKLSKVLGPNFNYFVACFVDVYCTNHTSFRRITQFRTNMAGRKGKAPKEEQPALSLGPQAREGENVFGVAHIFASFK
jgi:hypothetical protein